MTFTVGVWIEILLYISKNMVLCVTPLVGVWIEIQNQAEKVKSQRSLPSWECGLKLVFPYAQETLEFVYALAMVRLHTKK